MDVAPLDASAWQGEMRSFMNGAIRKARILVMIFAIAWMRLTVLKSLMSSATSFFGIRMIFAFFRRLRSRHRWQDLILWVPKIQWLRVSITATTTPSVFLVVSRNYFREGKQPQIMVSEALIVWAPCVEKHTSYHVVNRGQEHRDPRHGAKDSRTLPVWLWAPALFLSLFSSLHPCNMPPCFIKWRAGVLSYTETLSGGAPSLNFFFVFNLQPAMAPTLYRDWGPTSLSRPFVPCNKPEI
jgi:hypothetical protein